MSLMPVDEALRRVLDGAEPLEPETVSLADAAGRILAEAPAASRAQPPFPASAMDGYAVRAEDVQLTPVRLKLSGRSAAGHGFRGRVDSGTAVRIFTGAPVPQGADTIVIQENAKEEGGEVEILEPADPGAYIRPKGYDFDEGAQPLQPGLRLGARELMLAAAMNLPQLAVRRKPAVAILATGDELVPPGSSPAPDQIISSIPSGLQAAIRAWGGEPQLLGIAADRLESLSEHISRANGADILVTLGGASVGEHDLVQRALLDAGMDLGLWKIAMRPGKPLMFGRLGRQRVLGLPGNPVSAIICARIFVKPLIAALLGQDMEDEYQELPLAAPLPANGNREHYMRGRIEQGRVSAFEDQDSSLMRLLAEANCLIVRKAYAPPAELGELVRVLALDF